MTVVDIFAHTVEKALEGTALEHVVITGLAALMPWPRRSPVKGKQLTAVTDRQVRQLGIQPIPQHPERELHAAGAHVESARAVFEPLAHLTETDGRLVTGQNQHAGPETAQKMLQVAGGTPTPAPA